MDYIKWGNRASIDRTKAFHFLRFQDSLPDARQKVYRTKVLRKQRKECWGAVGAMEL